MILPDREKHAVAHALQAVRNEIKENLQTLLFSCPMAPVAVVIQAESPQEAWEGQPPHGEALPPILHVDFHGLDNGELEVFLFFVGVLFGEPLHPAEEVHAEDHRDRVSDGYAPIAPLRQQACDAMRRHARQIQHKVLSAERSYSAAAREEAMHAVFDLVHQDVQLLDSAWGRVAVQSLELISALPTLDHHPIQGVVPVVLVDDGDRVARRCQHLQPAFWSQRDTHAVRRRDLMRLRVVEFEAQVPNDPVVVLQHQRVVWRPSPAGGCVHDEVEKALVTEVLVFVDQLNIPHRPRELQGTGKCRQNHTAVDDPPLLGLLREVRAELVGPSRVDRLVCHTPFRMLLEEDDRGRALRRRQQWRRGGEGVALEDDVAGVDEQYPASIWRPARQTRDTVRVLGGGLQPRLREQITEREHTALHVSAPDRQA
mmetsp:Transcript_144752/g.463892  ORF Transcript_144752/g.463892 Transcript_144752/m.463892 type:complete len:427 (-) Transcript_144752:311-1591(-)